MKGYDNGLATRKAILNACKDLFYEKGYRETTHEDICKKAHVIRSSIYCHFKDKEAIRYEVMWEYMTALRKFFMDYHMDYPVFSPTSPTTQFYLVGYEQMYSRQNHSEPGNRPHAERNRRRRHLARHGGARARNAPFSVGRMDSKGKSKQI